MWYVVQTTTGKEQEFVDMMRKLLPGDSYEKCFLMKRRFLKRLGGKWTKVTETLFPSYLFLITCQPELLFYQMKQIPQFAKLLGNGEGEFIPLDAAEEEFLKKLYQESRNYTVELSQVILRNDGEIEKIIGPLKCFEDRLLCLNLRKRYAVVEASIGGKAQSTLLGICLEKD